jgi:hypothetical protein
MIDPTTYEILLPLRLHLVSCSSSGRPGGTLPRKMASQPTLETSSTSMVSLRWCTVRGWDIGAGALLHALARWLLLVGSRWLMLSLGNSIAPRSPESRSLVSAEDPGSKENLCDGFELYSPERGTSLILYRGAVVMPKCSNKAQSLPARIRDSAPKDSTSSASRYIFSSSVSLGGGYSSLVLSSVLRSSGCCCSSADMS